MTQQKKYSGVVVPMVTPFTGDRRVDTTAVSNLVGHLVNSGAHPFIMGTTGESASISGTERMTLVKETVKAARGRRLVYAGISGNCLSASVDAAKAYHDLGVDAVVATAPFYYPLDDEQLLRYFEELADNSPCPLIIYNIPATTHLSIPIIVVQKLSRHANIVGFKDSEKGIDRIDAATALWKDRPDFSYLLGWALQSRYALGLGADGIVPSTANLVPAVYQKIVEATLQGDSSAASGAQEKSDRVSLLYQKGRTLSHSLSALKVMLSLYGLCGPSMLPPLYRLIPAEEKQLMENTMSAFGTLSQINSIQ